MAALRATLLTFVLVVANLIVGVHAVQADSVSYTYDPLGRLVRVAYDNGASVVYNYDAAGNRTSVVVTAVTTAAFHGHLTLPGRPAAPDPSWQIPIRVSFFAPGTTTLLASATATTDTSGNFIVGNLTPRAYDVQIKSAQALSKLAPSINLLAGDNPSHDFGPLAFGDVNDDDAVDLLDFSILRTTFGRCVGDPGYDARADLNGDGCVDLLDFSLLRTNFGQFGPQPG